MKAKVAKLIARRRRRKFSGFLVPYAKEIEDLGGRAEDAPTRHATRAMLALVLALLWPSSSVSYTELSPQQYDASRSRANLVTWE